MVIQLSLVLLGILVAMLSAVSGIGGGGFYTPILHFILELEIRNALAVSSAGILVGSTLASIVYIRSGVARLDIAIPILVGQMFTSTISTYLTVVVDKTVIYVVLAGVLLYNGYKILANPRLEAGERVRPSPLGLLLLGMLTGLIAPLAGIGGGVIIVPALILLYGVDGKVATASSLVVIAASYMVVTSIHIGLGNMLVDYAAPLVAGILLGSYIGTKIHRRSSSRLIRLLVGLISLSFGLYTLYKLAEALGVV